MSVPRPAICVDTVIAPRAPASLMIAASSASFLAFSTTQGRSAAASWVATRSDSAMSRVPIRTGRPAACAAAISAMTACSLPAWVAYSRSGSSSRTEGRLDGITATSSP